MGIPSRANHTGRHQNSRHNFTSRLDKTSNELRKNKVIEKKKGNTNTLSLYRMKIVQTWRWAKDSRLSIAAPDPTNIDNPSASMSSQSTPLRCHTHLLFASRKLKKNNHKVYVSDGCQCTLRSQHSQCKWHSTNFNQCKLPAVPGNKERRESYRGMGKIQFLFPH